MSLPRLIAKKCDSDGENAGGCPQNQPPEGFYFGRTDGMVYHREVISKQDELTGV